MSEADRRLRRHARQIFDAGVGAVDPGVAVRRVVQRKNSVLTVGQTRYDLGRIGRVFVVGFGKAGFPMAGAIEERLGDRITAGLVVVKKGYGGHLAAIELREASHPVPDEAGCQAAARILDLVDTATEDDLVICLISGGGSALTPAPAAGVSLDEKQLTTQLLLDCGATIEEINAIRKHLSVFKGGQLARRAFPAPMHSLILSDVIGDRLDTIASGPGVPDETTFADCARIVQAYGLEKKLPSSVRERLRQGLAGEVEETPKQGDAVFNLVRNEIIGSNIVCLRAARAAAEKLGYNSSILSSSVRGETREVARVHLAVAEEILSSGNPLCPPVCILSGGETTVQVRGTGRGGRNQEFALACCHEMGKLSGLLFLSAGTDGTDGPTDAAGAFASPELVNRATRKGLSPGAYLANNDSYTFFQKIGGLFVTGPTNTNVMDIRILLVGSS